MKKITLVVSISFILVLITLLISGCQQSEGASSTLVTQESQAISTEVSSPTPTPKPTPEPTPNPGYTLHPKPEKDFRFSNWGDSCEAVRNSEIYSIIEYDEVKAISEIKLYGIPVIVEYHFLNDQLWIGEYKFPKLTDVKESVKLYDILEADLIDKYGEPTSDASNETKILIGWVLNTVVVALEYKDAVPTVTYSTPVLNKEKEESGGSQFTVHLDTFNTEKGKDFRYFNWGDSLETIVQMEAQSSMSEAVDMADDDIMFRSLYAVGDQSVIFNLVYRFEDNKLVQIGYVSKESFDEDLQGYISTIDWFVLNYGKSTDSPKINGATAYKWVTESTAITLAVTEDHKTVILIEPIES